MKYRIIGDTHGKIDKYISVASGAENSIQLGDMAVGFPGEVSHAEDVKLEKFLRTGNHRFIRGNHDNLQACRDMYGWIPDGTYDQTTGIMYIGGANSIDHASRVMGFDMWDDEELNHQQLGNLIDLYESVKPRVMITHDCPAVIGNSMFYGPRWDTKKELTKTKMALEAMLDIHQPAYWFFGHWHMTYLYNHPGISTQFMCLGELEYIDINLTDPKRSHRCL